MGSPFPVKVLQGFSPFSGSNRICDPLVLDLLWDLQVPINYLASGEGRLFHLRHLFCWSWFRLEFWKTLPDLPSTSLPLLQQKVHDGLQGVVVANHHISDRHHRNLELQAGTLQGAVIGRCVHHCSFAGGIPWVGNKIIPSQKAATTNQTNLKL